jgi:riboflavin synthase
MFTGIIEETGAVRAVQPKAKGIRLVVEAGAVLRGVRIGDSVAVNGCCLTAVALTGRGGKRRVSFDLLLETWDRTNLSALRPGSLVNLERPLRAGARFDGHFVTGHVDAIGRITRWEAVGKDYVLDVAAPAEVMRYVVFKGSVAVDGISLTVAGVRKGGFRIWIIPHTRAVTALRERKAGDAVNLEADILGKYVEKFTAGAARRRKTR